MSAPSQPPAITSPTRQRRRFPWRILALVTLLVAVIIGGVIWWNSRPDSSRSEALRIAGEGRFAEVEPQLKALLAHKPDDADVAEALARGYVKQENAAEAEAALDRWVELRPDDREARRTRFEFRRKSKDLAKAYPDGRRLLELEPKNELLPRVLMMQAFSIGKFDESEEYCRTALQSLPNDRSLRSMLAEIRRARGDFAEAGTVLDGLVKEFPTYTPALLARGNLHLDAGEPAKAVPLLRDVIRLDPTRARNAGYKLAVALEQSGEVEEAKRVTAEVRRMQAVANADEAVKNQPDSLALLTLQGEMLLAAGHTIDGLRFLTGALGRDPAFGPAHRVLADHYEKTGETAKHRRRTGS